jgi:hypothetical protein
MTQLTPSPETKNPISEFTAGDLEPINTQQESEDLQQVKQPIVLGLLKSAFRPILFTALGLHGLLLFVPLSSPTQVKPKETAEPVKLKRLSDKVLVKSMPKVKVTTTTKTTLPKVTVASSNPIVIKSTETPAELPKEEKKPDEKKPDEKKSDEKKPEKNTSDKPSDKGQDPSKVDPKKATTDANNTSDLDAETKKFAPIINGLNQEFNPNEELALIPEAEQLINPNPFFKNPALDETGAVVSNQTVETVVNGIKGKFTQFASKGIYANQPLYEAKVDGVIRYMSFVQADNINGQAVLIFLWKKSPI